MFAALGCQASLPLIAGNGLLSESGVRPRLKMV